MHSNSFLNHGKSSTCATVAKEYRGGCGRKNNVNKEVQGDREYTNINAEMFPRNGTPLTRRLTRVRLCRGKTKTRTRRERSRERKGKYMNKERFPSIVDAEACLVHRERRQRVRSVCAPSVLAETMGYLKKYYLV